MKIFRFILLLNLLLFNPVIGCQSSSLQIRSGDEVSVKLWVYCLQKLANDIRDSDFCIIGQIRVKNKEVLNEISIVDNTGKLIRKEPNKWKITGEVEVTSVVYGNPRTNAVSFSTIQITAEGIRKYGGIDEDGLPILLNNEGKDRWFFLFPEEGDTFIIIGKGQGKDAVVTRPIRPETVNVIYDMDQTGKITAVTKPINNAIQSRVESIHTVKNIESLPEPEQRKARQKLLSESNDTEVLIYLFCRGFNEGGLDRQIAIVKSLFNDNITPERRFISYWLADNILSPPSKQLVNDGPTEYLPYRCYEHFLKITPQQREVLNEIIIKSLAEIKTIDNGIIYLRLLNQRTIENDKILKENISPIISGLSLRFKNDKNYPEWEKWVKKIFPDEQPEK